VGNNETGNSKLETGAVSDFQFPISTSIWSGHKVDIYDAVAQVTGSPSTFAGMPTDRFASTPRKIPILLATILALWRSPLEMSFLSPRYISIDSTMVAQRN